MAHADIISTAEKVRELPAVRPIAFGELNAQSASVRRVFTAPQHHRTLIVEQRHRLSHRRGGAFVDCGVISTAAHPRRRDGDGTNNLGESDLLQSFGHAHDHRLRVGNQRLSAMFHCPRSGDPNPRTLDLAFASQCSREGYKSASRV
jgi:hypothetical protein